MLFDCVYTLGTGAPLGLKASTTNALSFDSFHNERVIPCQAFKLKSGIASALPLSFFPPSNFFFHSLTQRILPNFLFVPRDVPDTSTHATARSLSLNSTPSPLSRKHDTDRRPHTILRRLLTAPGQPFCTTANAALLLCLPLQSLIPMETTNAILPLSTPESSRSRPLAWISQAGRLEGTYLATSRRVILTTTKA